VESRRRGRLDRELADETEGWRLGLGWFGGDATRDGFHRTFFFLVLFFSVWFSQETAFTRDGEAYGAGIPFFFFSTAFPGGYYMDRRVVPDLGLGELLFFAVSRFDGEKRRGLAWQEARQLKGDGESLGSSASGGQAVPVQ
jgi:hypothetical protein